MKAQLNHRILPVALFAALLLCGITFADDDETAPATATPVATNSTALKQTPTLTLKLAREMAEVASRRAREFQAEVAVVVVGTDGMPLTVRRHENSPGLTYERALEQARTAWFDKKETVGGFPLLWKDQRTGGIGVCGGSKEVNREIGTAALETYTEALAQNLPLQTADKHLLKIILYVRRTEMEETAAFYREDIGLQQMITYPDWIVFEAGSASICLREKDQTSLRTKATNLALYSGTREEVEAIHTRLVAAGYNETDDLNPARNKMIGRLRHEEDMTTFWIKDPAGNTIQIESLRMR